MNATELRIDNLYMPTDGSASTATVTADDLKAWHSGAVYGKPLPLTDEWIVKFGFKDEGKSRYPHYLKGRIKITLGTVDWWTGLNLGEDGAQWLANIEYVHQLQNLYFALTGEELGLFTNQ